MEIFNAITPFLIGGAALLWTVIIIVFCVVTVRNKLQCRQIKKSKTQKNTNDIKSMSDNFKNLNE